MSAYLLITIVRVKLLVNATLTVSSPVSSRPQMSSHNAPGKCVHIFFCFLFCTSPSESCTSVNSMPTNLDLLHIFCEKPSPLFSTSLSLVLRDGIYERFSPYVHFSVAFHHLYAICSVVRLSSLYFTMLEQLWNHLSLKEAFLEVML